MASRPTTPATASSSALPFRTPTTSHRNPVTPPTATSHRTLSPPNTIQQQRRRRDGGERPYRSRSPPHPADLPESFPDCDSATDALRKRVISEGYFIVIKRSTKVKGVPNVIVYRCDRAGTHKSTSGGDREKASQRIGCPFEATVKRLAKKGGKWYISIRNPDHNHGPSGDVYATTSCKRWQKNDPEYAAALEVAVLRLSRTAQLTASQIAHYLSSYDNRLDQVDSFILGHLHHDTDDPFDIGSDDIIDRIRTQNIRLYRADIDNIRAKLRRKQQGNFTSTQLFINKLKKYKEDHGIEYFIYQDEGSGRIVRVFWSFKWCIDLWKDNPELMIMDNTYKVNRFNLPLFDIVGTTALHTTFYLAFGLSSGESEDDFRWHLDCLNTLRTRYSIPSPMVIISDFDRGFKKAALQAYPNVPQQLCIWHIMKNVIHHTNRDWVPKGATVSDRLLIVDEGLQASPNALEPDQPGPDPPSYYKKKQQRAAAAEGDNNNDDGSGDEEEDPEEAREEARATQLTGVNPDADLDIVDPRVTTFEQRFGRSEGNGIQPPPPRFEEWPDDRDGFVRAWKMVVYADSEELFQSTWAEMKRQYSRQIRKQNRFLCIKVLFKGFKSEVLLILKAPEASPSGSERNKRYTNDPSPVNISSCLLIIGHKLLR